MKDDRKTEAEFGNEQQLTRAIEEGDAEAVEVFLEAGPNVNCTTDLGNTPLTLAVWHNHTAIAKMLLAAGADVDHVGYFGCECMTPVAMAIMNGNTDLMMTLLEAGADVDGGEWSRTTPLYAAVSCCRVEEMEVLLRAGANVNLGKDCSWTPLWRAAGLGRIEFVETLLAAGADPNCQWSEYDQHDECDQHTRFTTPLWEAVARG